MRFFLTLLLLLLAAWPADASLPPIRLGRDAALIQTRSCVGETQFHHDTCVAMTWIHMKRAQLHGTTLATMASRYSTVIRRPRRAWIFLLKPEGPMPMTWPRRISWSRYQERFRDLHEKVEEVLRGEVSDPCPDAMHYGGPMDAVPRGYEAAPACLPDRSSRQIFYRRIVTTGDAT